MSDDYKPAIQNILNGMIDIPFRQEAERALTTLPNSVDDLITLANILATHTSETVIQNEWKGFICWLLGRIHTKASLDSLLRFANNQDIEVAAEAIRSLALSTIKFDTMPFVHRFQSDPPVEIKIAILYALHHLENDLTFVAFFLDVLNDTSQPEEVRGMAAEGLGEMGNPAAVLPLIEALAMPSTALRFWAVFAVGQLKDARAIPALEHLKETDHTPVEGWGKTISESAIDAIATILGTSLS